MVKDACREMWARKSVQARIRTRGQPCPRIRAGAGYVQPCANCRLGAKRVRCTGSHGFPCGPPVTFETRLSNGRPTIMARRTGGQGQDTLHPRGRQRLPGLGFLLGGGGASRRRFEWRRRRALYTDSVEYGNCYLLFCYPCRLGLGWGRLFPGSLLCLSLPSRPFPFCLGGR